MEDYFYERFKYRSDRELQHIIDYRDGYQIEAVNAANRLLVERDSQKSVQYVTENSVHKGVYNFDKSNRSFDLIPFLRTLSYRDFLSIFTLVLLLMAYIELSFYCLGESNVQSLYGPFRNIGVIGFLWANHVLYKIEHKRFNNFIGRVLHTLIFIIMFLPIKIIHSYLVSDYYTFSVSLSFGEMILLLVVSIIAITLFEFVLSILKYGLKLLKWQIF
jgi:hypothetical protein